MAATAGMGGDAMLPEEETDIFASIRPLTEGPVFIGLQVNNFVVCSTYNSQQAHGYRRDFLSFGVGLPWGFRVSCHTAQGHERHTTKTAAAAYRY